MLKPLIRSFFRSLGLDIHRALPLDSYLSPVRRYRKRLMKDRGISLLVDVGAHIGLYSLERRADSYHGRIVTFEPLPIPFERLIISARGDDNWTCLNEAVGNEDGVLEFNVAENEQSSSFLPMDERHVSAMATSVYQAKKQVQVVRLDSVAAKIAAPNDKVWLKLDVQGFELVVIEGAKKFLDQVQVIETEASLVTLYTGQPLLTDMINHFESLGFHPVFIEEAFRDEKTDQLLQVDVIFARS